MKVFSGAFLFLLYCLIAAGFAQAQSAGGIKGKVRNPRGAGIADAEVSATQKGQDIKSTKTDRSGEFTLDGLSDGFYNIRIEKSGYSSGVRYNVEVRGGKVNNIGDRLILSGDQGSQVIVKGSVFNQDGVSIYGAEVKIERISDDGEAKKVGAGFTSEGGEFTFRFPEGAAKFRITAKAKGVSASKEISVSEAAVYRLAISLDLSSKL